MILAPVFSDCRAVRPRVRFLKAAPEECSPLMSESVSDLEKPGTGADVPSTADRAPRTRAVIVSTPRGGNTWLRHLLSVAYEIPTIAVHNPRDLDWSTLPRDCILQMHWHPIPSFLARLEQH